ADRANSDKAKKAIGVTVAFKVKQAFEDVAAPVAQAFARDADMQMFLSSGYDHFGQFELEDASYRAALAVKDDAAIRPAYGAFLLRRLRPDDARPQLQEILQ